MIPNYTSIEADFYRLWLEMLCEYKLKNNITPHNILYLLERTCYAIADVHCNFYYNIDMSEDIFISFNILTSPNPGIRISYKNLSSEDFIKNKIDLMGKNSLIKDVLL